MHARGLPGQGRGRGPPRHRAHRGTRRASRRAGHGPLRGAWATPHGARCMTRANGAGRGVPGRPWNTPCSARDPTRHAPERLAHRTRHAAGSEVGLERLAHRATSAAAGHRRTRTRAPCWPGQQLRGYLAVMSRQGSTSDAGPRSRPMRPARTCPATRGFADLASIGGWLRRQINRGRRSGGQIRGRGRVRR